MLFNSKLCKLEKDSYGTYQATYLSSFCEVEASVVPRYFVAGLKPMTLRLKSQDPGLQGSSGQEKQLAGHVQCLQILRPMQGTYRLCRRTYW